MTPRTLTYAPGVLDQFRGRLFLKVAEVGRLTQSDPRTVRRSIELGQLEAVRLGDNTIRVPAAPFWRLCGLDPETLRPVIDRALDPETNNEAGPDQTDLADIVQLTGVRHGHSDPPAST